MKRVLLRTVLYGSLAVAVAAAFFSFRWYRWQGYRTVQQRQGITIYSDMDTATVGKILGLCCVFREYYRSNILPVPEGNADVYLFGRQADYLAYCRRIRAGRDTPSGFYSRRHRLIVMHAQTGIGTLFHELSHCFVHQGGHGLALWLEEGLSAYFEKGMGYYERDDDHRLFYGYLNPVKFQEIQLSARSGQLSFAEFERSQHAAGTFMVYADRRRSLRPFLSAYLRTRDLDASCRQAFGAGSAQVERDWASWAAGYVLGFDHEFWRNANYYTTRQGFEDYLARFRARWDDSLEIYTANPI